LRAIVEYEDVAVAICVDEPRHAEWSKHSVDSVASQPEHFNWNFSSADAAALDTLGAWPMHESNPFLKDVLQKSASFSHTSRVDEFKLSHDASYYRSLIASIQDQFRFVFIVYNPSVRGSERACLRTSQCDYPGCMSLLRAGLLPVTMSVSNITRMFPSLNGEPWFIVSAGDAHLARADEISTAAKNISEWAKVGAQFRLLEELNQENFALYTFSRPVVIFFTGPADSHNVAIKRVLRAAAARFLHRVRFGHLNGLRYHDLALKFGVNHSAPTIVLVDNAKNFSAVTLQFLPVIPTCFCTI
jgi:hypothetical protein